jgi:hypothetical protein
MNNSPSIFPETAERLSQWQADRDVLGVLLVGSKSRGHADGMSDDDVEVLMTDEAFARLSPPDCSEYYAIGRSSARRIIFDAQYTTLSELQRKPQSWLDIDHWPYERAQVLFDRDGRVVEAVAAAGRMDPKFRRLRLLHATIDAWMASARARKTLRRRFAASGHLGVARGAKALARIIFALEGRWLPMDHWLDAELDTLADPTGAGPAIVDALRKGSPEPLVTALAALEDRLFVEGVARPAGRTDLFLELLHANRAEERAKHGLF